MLTTIASEKITTKANPEWVWTVLSDPYYFTCWYGMQPETSWQINSEICLSLGPNMKAFDTIGVITKYTPLSCLGFKVYIPSIFHPNTPEHQVEIVFHVMSLKKKVEVLLEVTASQQWNETSGLKPNHWKTLLRSLKKTIEDPYLLNQAQTNT
jgi:hypothetical protein